jgi:hypothetical protein
LTILFSDGFEPPETSAFENWSGSTTIRTTLTVSPDRPFRGVNSAKVVTSPPGGFYGDTHIDVDLVDCYAREYFQCDYLPDSVGDDNGYNVLTFVSPETWAFMQTRLCFDGANYYWRIFTNGGPLSANSAVFTAFVDTWYCVEMHGKLNDAVNGIYEVWINGIPVITETGIDTSANSKVNHVYFGACELNTSELLNFYYDECVVADQYIGPDVPVYPARLTLTRVIGTTH